ncbi:MAG: carboxymuconolactone decarboxylase family protein [Pseudonocardiales bacterium]|nr:carboxymuconolactone decarboxylase family protein [Pseudonocardiales bacterium]
MQAVVRDGLGFVDTDPILPEFNAAKGRFMRVAFRSSGVDPVALELIRYRNGRLQNCQGCQAYRDPKARAAGADEDTLAAVDDYENSDLDEAKKVVLRLTDTYLGSPGNVSAELRKDLLRYYSPEQIVQMVLRLSSTTSNRVVRALALDKEEATA